MADTIASDRPAATSSRRLVRVLTVLGIAFVCFLLGLRTGDREVEGLKTTNNSLEKEVQALTGENRDLRAKLADLQSTFDSAQSVLDAVMPSVNGYAIGPNQSLIVADGQLQIGLIGAPRSDSIELNINGKQYSLAAGDVLNVESDPPNRCRVAVMSFDVLKANVVVNASCAQAKQ